MEITVLKQSNGNRDTLSLSKRSDLKVMERSESRVQISSGSGRRVGEGGVPELVMSLKDLHKCVSSLSGSKGNAPSFTIMLQVFLFCFLID